MSERVPRQVVVALGVSLLAASCAGSDDDVPTPAAPTIEQGALDADYGSENLTAQGLNLVRPPILNSEASDKLNAFAALMVADGRCTTVRRHHSAVVASGVGLGCLRSSDLMIESGILAADPAVMRASSEHVDRFAVAPDRAAGSVELHDEYVVLLIENHDATFTVAIDTISSATENQSINDIILAKGRFTS